MYQDEVGVRPVEFWIAGRLHATTKRLRPAPCFLRSGSDGQPSESASAFFGHRSHREILATWVHFQEKRGLRCPVSSQFPALPMKPLIDSTILKIVRFANFMSFAAPSCTVIDH